jgi:very-short-patch-repair endonuclease
LAKEKIYLFDHSPHLRDEWDYAKNTEHDPLELTYGTAKRVYWKCSNNHSWDATVANRARLGSGCPYCTGWKALKGVNDLATLYPDLSSQLLDPTIAETIKPMSNKKLDWVCEKGHTWSAIVASRTKGHGCPYCSNNKLLVGFNDLETVDPKLAKELDDPNLTSKDLIGWGHTKSWWKCNKGHRWESTPSNRRTRGCPYCAGKAIVLGQTDLATTHPDLCKELVDINDGYRLSYGSDVKVSWTCKLGHIWSEQVGRRARRGFGCPYCSNHKILKGFNDLKTTHPHLITELNEPSIDPATIFAGSPKKVKWKCLRNHEWVASLSSRSYGGNGCSVCSRNQTSAIEGALREELDRVFDEVRPDHRSRVPVEGFIYSTMSVDILIPSEDNLVVEYDGSYWHKDTIEKDTRKTQILLKNGYRVVRIRESNKTDLHFLDIQNPDLLQLRHRYMEDDLLDLVDQIQTWQRNK